MTFTTTNPDKPTTIKDPDATLDYGWDLTNEIDEGDTIASVVFTPDPASTMTLTHQSIVGLVAYAWLAGGISGTWGVTAHYTTAQGRIDDRTLYFKIKDR